MMNEKVEIQIGNRRLSVEMEDLLPMQISALAQLVTDRMAEIQKQHNKTADTSKLYILVMMSFAADYERERHANETMRRAIDSTAERLTESLRESLEESKRPDGE